MMKAMQLNYYAGVKICKKCGVEKDETDFYESNKWNICKECLSIKNKKIYLEKGEIILARAAEYRRIKKFRQKWGVNEINNYFTPRYNITPEINEATMKIPECICSFFGCGKPLSLIEKLAGNKCTNHMEVVKNKHIYGKL